jgi:hypothetical protein
MVKQFYDMLDSRQVNKTLEWVVEAMAQQLKARVWSIFQTDLSSRNFTARSGGCCLRRPDRGCLAKAKAEWPRTSELKRFGTSWDSRPGKCWEKHYRHGHFRSPGPVSLDGLGLHVSAGSVHSPQQGRKSQPLTSPLCEERHLWSVSNKAGLTEVCYYGINKTYGEFGRTKKERASYLIKLTFSLNVQFKNKVMVQITVNAGDILNIAFDQRSLTVSAIFSSIVIL